VWKIVSSRYGVLLAVLTVGALLAQVSGYSLKDLLSQDRASSPAQGSDEGQGRQTPAHTLSPSQPTGPATSSPASPAPDPSDVPTAPQSQPPGPTPSRPPLGGVPAYSSFSITVPGPGWCERTQVDLDGRSVVPGVEPTDDVLGASVDFTYSGCEQGLTYRTVDGMGLGFGSSNMPTRAQCAELARSSPLAQPEPISSINAGTALCAITSSKAVAWIKVTYVGSPYGAGDPETPPKPSLRMTVTLWR